MKKFAVLAFLLANSQPLLAADAPALYQQHCAVCHGPSGLGDGPVTRLGVPPPPSLLSERSRAMPDGRLFHIITYGVGNMPPYAGQVDRLDRWKAVLHIRSLQSGAKTP